MLQNRPVFCAKFVFVIILSLAVGGACRRCMPQENPFSLAMQDVAFNDGNGRPVNGNYVMQLEDDSGSDLTDGRYVIPLNADENGLAKARLIEKAGLAMVEVTLQPGIEMTKPYLSGQIFLVIRWLLDSTLEGVEIDIGENSNAGEAEFIFVAENNPTDIRHIARATCGSVKITAVGDNQVSAKISGDMPDVPASAIAAPQE